jgi:hypothetical protein
VASKAILHDLTLLLHPVSFERFARLDLVAIGTRSDPHFSEEQVANLGGCAPSEIASRSPGLILAAMGELVRQYRRISLASIGKEYVIAEGDCTVPAGEEDYAPEYVRHSDRTAPVQPYRLTVHDAAEVSQRSMLIRAQPVCRH